jgi:hypothetical protein
MEGMARIMCVGRIAMSYSSYTGLDRAKIIRNGSRPFEELSYSWSTPACFHIVKPSCIADRDIAKP